MIAARFLDTAAYMVSMNINTSIKTANDLRRMLRITDTTPGSGHLFERDNGDVLLLAATVAGDPANDSYIAGVTPMTATEGLTIVVAEHLTPSRKGSRSPMRRIRVINNGHVGEAVVSPAPAVHRRIIDWWEGEHAFVSTK